MIKYKKIKSSPTVCFTYTVLRGIFECVLIIQRKLISVRN